jgi:hypothetical protein
MGRFHVVIHALQVDKHTKTYQRSVNMAFKEYLGVFMKLFLDDFNVFSDLKTHMAKL